MGLIIKPKVTVREADTGKQITMDMYAFKTLLSIRQEVDEYNNKSRDEWLRRFPTLELYRRFLRQRNSRI